MKVKTGRNSAFEIMRLTAMFMIVLEHCLLATSLHTDAPMSIVDNVAWFIDALTVCAVNLFFLLTGYFLRDGNFKISRIADIWVKTIFYSVAVYLIAVLCNAESFSVKSLVGFACPVFSKKYWFIQTYVVLALLAPYLVSMAENLSRKKYLILICILLIFFSLHETFIPVKKTLDTTQGYGIIWGCILALIGNYIHKYGEPFLERIKGGVLVACYFFIAFCMFISNILIVKFDIAQGITSRGNFYAYNSMSVFLESVFLFCAFIKLSRKNIFNKTVNWMATSAVAVYLIHAHPVLLYPLWTDILKFGKIIDRPVVYVMAAVVASAIVLLMCILIDKLVGCAFERLNINKAIKNLDHLSFNEAVNGDRG